MVKKVSKKKVETIIGKTIEKVIKKTVEKVEGKAVGMDEGLFCCPLCKRKLLIYNLTCTQCQQHYKNKEGIPILLPPAMQEEFVRLQHIYEREDVAKSFGFGEEYTGSVKYRNVLREKVAALAERAPEGSLLLDIGCGNGLLLEKIAQRRRDLALVGVDFSLPMILEAKKRVPSAQLAVASVHALPFKDEAAETVICIDVLKNFSKKAMVFAALDELFRATRQKVIVELVIPSMTDKIVSLTYKAMRCLTWKPRVEQTPLAGISVNKISMKEIMEYLKNYKWSKVKVNPLLNWTIFNVRIR